MKIKDTKWNFNTVSTVTLIILMLIYLAMTLWSSNRMAEHTEVISGHPFVVVASAGDLKTSVSEMQIRTERLLMHRSEDDIIIVRNALETIGRSMEAPLEKIRALYLGRSQDVTDLESMLRQLNTEAQACLDFASREENSLGAIEIYEAEHLVPLYEQTLEQLEDIIRSAQEKKVEYGLMAESLRSKTLIGSVVLMGLMIGVLLSSQRLAHRQKRELQLRSRLFDNLSTSIDDTFLIRSAGTEEIYYTALNMERVLGHSVNKLDDVYKVFEPEEVMGIRRIVHDGNFDSPLSRTMEYRLPDGEKRWMTVRIYKAGDIEARQVISVFTDCTDEIKSNQALQDALLNAECANEAKSEFLSRMSHEIRTPLNAVIGMTTIAAASVDSPAKVGDCLAKIHFSSRHLLLLINDILDMSKIESAKMSLQKDSFDLSQVLNSFADAVCIQAKAKGVEFTEKMEGFGGRTRYIGDSLRISQILLNLGSNAVKFTGPGGRVSVTVSCPASRMSTDVLRFVVEDTGIGMDARAIERIYKPFEQADPSIASRYGGTGLGMSITKNLVTLMSGRIEVQSEPGKGTVCIVDLPMLRDKDERAQADIASPGLSALAVDDEPAVCAEVTALRDKHLLVAEDNELNREILTELLTMNGVTAESAPDGQEALELFLSSEPGHFDGILMDVQMPVMNGYEAARRIRASGHPDAAGIPVIATTANAFTDDISAALAAGMNGHVSKPIDMDQLCRVLSEAISRRRIKTIDGRA